MHETQRVGGLGSGGGLERVLLLASVVFVCVCLRACCVVVVACRGRGRASGLKAVRRVTSALRAGL